MHWFHSEPTISELLSDPIVKAMMAADKVAPEELEKDLSKIAAKLDDHEVRRTAVQAIRATDSVSTADCI